MRFSVSICGVPIGREAFLLQDLRWDCGVWCLLSSGVVDLRNNLRQDDGRVLESR